jgi:hypothetical protein
LIHGVVHDLAELLGQVMPASRSPTTLPASVPCAAPGTPLFVSTRRISFPDNTRLIGASGSWLDLYNTDNVNGGQRRYLLHNAFTKTTVSLPGLDSVIGKVSNRFKIRKVLMRSDQDVFFVVATN